MTLHEFLTMGGYAEYVWSAYGIVFVVLIAILLSSIKSHNKLFK